MGFLFAFSLGVFSVAWWQQLPDQNLMLFALAALSLIWGVLRWVCGRRLWVATMLLMLSYLWGSCWGLQAAYQSLGHQLPEALDRQEFVVTGTIVGLVDSNNQRSRFDFRVDSINGEQSAHSAISAHSPMDLQLLQLSSYGQSGTEHSFAPGQHWQFTVRLRRPRGFLNPGTFDYQRWLVQRGVSATGYIVAAEANGRINQPGHNKWCQLQDAINRWRHQVVLKIQAADLSNQGRAVLAALTIGDKRQITGLWNSLVRLGIVHLMIVSGLHVGLVAGFGFIIGGRAGSLLAAGCRLFSSIDLSPAVRWLAPIAGLGAAGVYSLLAGFSLPAQRALIAVSVVMVARLCLRRVRPLSCIVWALFLMALSQPLAVLSSGFWLSFLAVIILVAWFYPWHSIQVRFNLKQVLGAQLALTVGLLIPSLVLVGVASWLGPLVNLLAVPWISLITVPLALLGCLCLLFWFQAAETVWLLADYSITGLWFVLDLIPEHLSIISSPVPLSSVLVTSGLVAALGWLLPGGLGIRLLAAIPLWVYLLAPSEASALRLSVLDVGQGLAVVLETPEQVMVYDAGPSYGGRFNAGAGIIAPYLRSRGRSQIDMLVVSHEDMDHAGGLLGLAESMPIKELVVGPGLSDISIGAGDLAGDSKVCAAGQSWSWPVSLQANSSEQVHFKILAPNTQSLLYPLNSPPEGNNFSCVLLISWRDQLILLPGDIEREIESELLTNPGLPQVDILLAPHHGSATSSTLAFVAALKPAHVVFSAGYRHHFGHPHPAVRVRYGELGSQLWNTAEQGALSFVWSESGELAIEAARPDGPQFWWRAASVDSTGIMLEFDPVAED